VYPTLHLGPWSVSTFLLALLAAFVVAGWVGVAQARVAVPDESPAFVLDIALWGGIAGLLGARLWYAVVHLPELMRDPAEVLLHGGLVWYGGLLAGVIAGAWRYRQLGLPFSRLFDYGAAAVIIGHGIGRLGCFLVGDDYGTPTSSWIGIAFPHGAPPSTAGYLRAAGADVPATVPDAAVLRVHPTQLYEAFGALVIFAIVLRMSRRPFRPWTVFGTYALLYGVERFLLEIIRPKDDRFVHGLTVSQLASIALALVGAWLVTRGRRAAVVAPLAR